MQTSDLFPQLSDNMRKKITSILTLRRRKKPAKDEAVEYSDPRTAKSSRFGKMKERPLGQVRRKAARAAGKAIREKE